MLFFFLDFKIYYIVSNIIKKEINNIIHHLENIDEILIIN